MKIAVLLENPISVGGGFNQALNAILQLQRVCGDRHQLRVYTTIPANLPHIRSLQIDVACLTSSGMLGALRRIVRAVARRVGFRVAILAADAAGMEKVLLADGVDLAYFVTQSSTPIHFRKLNYITTIHDECHRDNVEFPEVANREEFVARERHFFACLPRAVAIVVASEQLAQRTVLRYGVDSERMVAMPFEPSPFLTREHARDREGVLADYGLQAGYYFYPAQFWPHKNHVRLLEALAILAGRLGPMEDLRLVFSGGDQGNMKWVQREAERLGVSDRVCFLGFVPAVAIRGLYEGARAVVMPTYFGPTNMPPLEAWALERPLIYSKHISEQIGDAALLADVDSAADWADAMERVRNPQVAAALVDCGRRQWQWVEQQRHQAEVELARRMNQFAVRRGCWE